MPTRSRSPRHLDNGSTSQHGSLRNCADVNGPKSQNYVCKSAKLVQYMRTTIEEVTAAQTSYYPRCILRAVHRLESFRSVIRPAPAVQKGRCVVRWVVECPKVTPKVSSRSSYFGWGLKLAQPKQQRIEVWSSNHSPTQPASFWTELIASFSRSDETMWLIEGFSYYGHFSPARSTAASSTSSTPTIAHHQAGSYYLIFDPRGPPRVAGLLNHWQCTL